MNSLRRTGWPLLLTGVFAVISVGSWWFFAPRPTQAESASYASQRTNSDDAAASPAPKHSTVYDPDPQHLWNRLHDTFRARIWDRETDPWELDPFLWRSEDYLASDKGQKAALEVLDEFIAKKSHTLIKDPRKRALLQRDLWALFDSLPVPRWAAQKDPQKGLLELAKRVARIIPLLSLTADEIKKLPDNYAEAVAAKEAWFLPADLWKPKGPWVLLGDDNRMPLALSHIHFFGGRSTFFVFLRMRDGREQTEKYLAALRKLAPGAAPHAFPPGTDAILVRQMQLIDDQGKPVTTNVTESLQLREGAFELKLNRRAFLAGKPSLKAIGEDDRERDLLLFMGNNAGQGPSNVLKTCFSCHQGMKDILSLNSFRRFKPLYLTPMAKPDLLPSTWEEEEKRCRGWKANRYEWGLLQGLKQSGPID